MKKKYILIGIGIILLVIVGLYIYREIKIAEYKKQYFDYMNSELDKFIDSCPDSSAHPITFRANLFFAHEAAIEKIPLETLLKSVDAFAEAGVSGIDINMGFFPWMENKTETIEKYDKLIKHIRSKNLELNINPQFASLFQKVSSFEEFKEKTLELHKVIAQRYQPDRFIVFHEPTTMNEWMGLDITPKQWAEFAKEASLIVKNVSPKTKTGVGFLTMIKEERNYFDESVLIEDLDIITVDIYALKGIDVASKIVEIAKNKRKIVYIEETGRPNFFVPRFGQRATLRDIAEKGIGAEEFQELDIKWLEAITCFTVNHELETVTTFWPQPFFKYTKEGGAFSPKYNLEVIKAIDNGERTEYFYVLKELIQKWGNKNYESQ